MKMLGNCLFYVVMVTAVLWVIAYPSSYAIDDFGNLSFIPCLPNPNPSVATIPCARRRVASHARLLEIDDARKGSSLHSGLG